MESDLVFRVVDMSVTDSALTESGSDVAAAQPGPSRRRSLGGDDTPPDSPGLAGLLPDRAVDPVEKVRHRDLQDDRAQLRLASRRRPPGVGPPGNVETSS